MADQKVSKKEEKEQVAQIIARAWKDPEFKKLLLSDPKTALRELHIPIPEGKMVRFVEEGQKFSKDENIATFVLPRHPADIHKLSEKELAALAGGWGCSLWQIVVEPPPFG